MRYLVILLLTICCSATLLAQKGSSDQTSQKGDQIILKSIKVNTEQKQLPLKEQILMIKGQSIYAAKGYQIVYSKTLKEAWFQVEGVSISTDDIIAMKKKDKGKNMTGMTVFCNGYHGCTSCAMVNIGSVNVPAYVCQGTCSCGMIVIPDKRKVLEFETPGGNLF